jgi:hypothetical protein
MMQLMCADGWPAGRGGEKVTMLSGIRKNMWVVLPWIGMGIAVLLVGIWGDHTSFLRDAMIYRRAVAASHAGQDPYLASLALQQHALRFGPDENTWAFVYPPITLPFLHLVGLLPVRVYETLYWLLYSAGAITQLCALLSILTPEERRAAKYVVPAGLLFPATMFLQESLFGGNVVYLFYGAIFGAAVAGWRKGHWTFFYAAVFVTSCVKPQMLSMLLIPMLSGAGQWLGSILTGVFTLLVTAAEMFLWPVTYREWRHAIDVQVALFDREFAFGPTGILGRFLWKHGRPYQLACAIFFLCFAALILLALAYLTRLYRAGKITLTDWLPVLLIGVILLNPRLMGNDFYAVTVPVALILWRAIRAHTRSWKTAVFWSLAVMLVANLVAQPTGYYPDAITLVMFCFVLGGWRLHQQAQRLEPRALAAVA